MKVLVASDIHGSAYYCQKLIQAFNREKADKILLLGDVLYHGPRNELPRDYEPKSVIKMLNELKNKILCVRGNCDTEVDQMVLEFPILADYACLFINGRCIYATHGHKYNPENPLPMEQGDVMFFGHTHIPMCEARDGRVFINTGSVSIPKENSAHAYAVIEDETVYFKTIDGNIYNTYTL